MDAKLNALKEVEALNEVEDFEHFERELHALFVAAEREMLGDALCRCTLGGSK